MTYEKEAPGDDNEFVHFEEEEELGGDPEEIIEEESEEELVISERPGVAAAPQPLTAARKPAAKKQTTTAPSREEIARLAEKFWAERGRPEGSPEQDWLRAEQELKTAS